MFGHGFDVHGLIRLDSDHKLITTALPLKDVPWNVTELHTYLCFAFIQSWKEQRGREGGREGVGSREGKNRWREREERKRSTFGSLIV